MLPSAVFAPGPLPPSSSPTLIGKSLVPSIGETAEGSLTEFVDQLHAAAAVSAATFGGALGTVQRATAGAWREPIAVVAEARIADAATAATAGTAEPALA